MIIEHRLEDVLWRNVDRIVLMSEGEILADLHPDELLSTRLLEENGIWEPLFLTALRYAGVELAPAKKPAHVLSLPLLPDGTRTSLSFSSGQPGGGNGGSGENPVVRRAIGQSGPGYR